MASNPFVTSTAVRARSLFFGRQEEIKQLYAALSANSPQHSVVVGLPKSGKSSLLMALANPEMQKQHLDDPSKFLFVPVDCSVAHAVCVSLLLRRRRQRQCRAAAGQRLPGSARWRHRRGGAVGAGLPLAGLRRRAQPSWP